MWSAVDLSVEESRLLTDYATVTRCPGDYEPVSLDKAQHGVAMALRVRNAVLKILQTGS